MSHELMYTSAPRGLKPGSQGFCTVAATPGMPPVLSDLLESLSGYRHLSTERGDVTSPVVWSHLRATLVGHHYYVLSRIGDAGLDYTRRTNKFAHHLVLDASELPPAGPAWVLGQSGLMTSAWQGEPRWLLAGRKPALADEPARACSAWAAATGDAGWGGVLAATAAGPSPRMAWIVCPSTLDVLPLVAEALALLPAELRWKVTFSTYFTRLPAGIDCQWRFILADSPEVLLARRNVAALVLDLSVGLGVASPSPWVDAARSGQFPTAIAEPVGSLPPAAPPVESLPPVEHLPSAAGWAPSPPLALRSRRRFGWRWFVVLGLLLAVCLPMLYLAAWHARRATRGGKPPVAAPVMPLPAPPVVQMPKPAESPPAPIAPGSTDNVKPLPPDPRPALLASLPEYVELPAMGGTPARGEPRLAKVDLSGAVDALELRVSVPPRAFGGAKVVLRRADTAGVWPVMVSGAWGSEQRTLGRFVVGREGIGFRWEETSDWAGQLRNAVLQLSVPGMKEAKRIQLRRPVDCDATIRLGDAWREKLPMRSATIADWPTDALETRVVAIEPAWTFAATPWTPPPAEYGPILQGSEICISGARRHLFLLRPVWKETLPRRAPLVIETQLRYLGVLIDRSDKTPIPIEEVVQLRERAERAAHELGKLDGRRAEAAAQARRAADLRDAEAELARLAEARLRFEIVFRYDGHCVVLAR